MTNHLKFSVESIGPCCYFAVGVWLSNFCHCFNYLLGTFS